MARNSKIIITKDRTPEIRQHIDSLIVALYTKHKYTLEEIMNALPEINTIQGIYKIIQKAKGGEENGKT